MRRWNHVRLGLCLPVLALVGLAGCENHDGDGYYGVYGYPYGGYDRGWWTRSDDHGYWKERKYDRLKNDDRKGDAERFNDRLCHNGIRGDAPGDCKD